MQQGIVSPPVNSKIVSSSILALPISRFVKIVALFLLPILFNRANSNSFTPSIEGHYLAKHYFAAVFNEPFNSMKGS